MPKAIYICEDVVAEMCDNISEALVSCAEGTFAEIPFSDEFKSLVEITTRHYRSLLLAMMFEEQEGE